MFILPSVVHAVNFTLYLGTTPLTTPFPTGGRLAVETAPTTRREISPGEFDASGVMGSVCSVDTDAGQWRPNETISNTSAARQIGSACHVTNDAGKLDAGWLWNSTDLTGYNLSNSTERNGNWSFQITTRSGQTNGVEVERILARVSVVRNEGGTLTLIKDLLETRVTGAGTTLNLGQQGWRDSDFRVTHASTSSDTLYNIEVGPTNESYIFRKGDALYFELGFGDGGDATDRTLTLIYNISQTNITTPNFIAVNVTANCSFTTNPTTMYTGETSVFTGNCTVVGGTVDLDIRIQDNSTGSFANSSTSSSSAVYVNVTNYTISSVTGNSASFTFLVNASKPGTYQFRTQCQSDQTRMTEANSSDTPSVLTVNQAVGYLNVTINTPAAGSSTNKIQNTTFDVNATVVCISNSSNPTAICG